jgi:hypothetical protein
VLKRSVFLATGFAVAIVVAVPFLGGTGAVVTASGVPVGSTVFAASPSVGAAALGKAAVGATSESIAESAEPAARTNSDVQSDAAASAPSSNSTQSEQSGDSVRNNSQAQSLARGIPAAGASRAPGVTARLAASGHRTIVSQKPPTSSAPTDPSPPQSCPADVTGDPSTVPGTIAEDGLQGTTNQDLANFALEYNANRIANCLPPIALANIRFDKCLSDRMFWIAEDPSTNPSSAWGHDLPRSDGAKMRGCDGDIAGGLGDTGTTAADKWWQSTDHRASLYQPKWGNDSYSNVCIGFAIVHGGLPLGTDSMSRESARWEDCSTFGK